MSRTGDGYPRRDDNHGWNQTSRSASSRRSLPERPISRQNSRYDRGSSSMRGNNAKQGTQISSNKTRIRSSSGLLTTNADFHRRKNILIAAGALVVVVLILRLAWVQLIVGPDLAAQAQNQRSIEIVDAARRGSITDRNGKEIAFTMEARSITVHPSSLREYIDEAHRLNPEKVAEYDKRLQQIADELPDLLGVENLDRKASASRNRRQAEPEEDAASEQNALGVSPKEILAKLRDESSTYEVLVRNVDPDKADAVVKKFPELVAERQDIRQYPNGATAANIVGKIGQDGVGQFGFEAAKDATLQGINGGKTVDIAANGIAIPGSTRDVRPSVDGTSYQLTLDLDMQYYVQQQVNQAKTNSGAKDAAAVVLDAKTGEILSIAQADTANPNKDLGEEVDAGRNLSDSAVSSPFEPGSVAKIITAAAGIEDGVTTPDEVLQVPGSIEMSGVTVRDAWEHDTTAMTTTGVFSKSSNVGTLMLAQRVGQDRFADMLHLFGLGQSTGVELPNESAGLVPQRPQWSGGTFANLPIGQGMAMTLLQMTGIYQTIANDGERIPPRIIQSEIKPDGTEVTQPEPDPIRVVSPETAKTVRAMFEGVMQKDPNGGNQSGTAAESGIEGYRLTGKTGTAQKVDPDTGAYSNSKYYITFAGIAPADDPRFVVGIMLDEPVRGVHGEGGQSAAPLFKDIANWALNKYNVPLSTPRDGMLLLEP